MSRFASPRHVLAAALVASVVGCASKPAAQPEAAPPPPEPLEHALSGLAAQHVVVLPVYIVRAAPGFPGASAVGNPTDLARTLDADILAAFDEHGLRRTWIFPPDLVESYKHNPTYATDPYGLAEEPLRTAKAGRDARLPEPIASELRTLVAFHEDARLILAPLELRLEPVGAHAGRGVLHLVLIDARASNVVWMGDVVSDTVPTFGPEISASVASRLANVVAIR
jgi:hypothetical protein